VRARQGKRRGRRGRPGALLYDMTPTQKERGRLGAGRHLECVRQKKR
jgi:hypothetical protein